MRLNNAHRKLKARMITEGVDQKTIARERGRSPAYITLRMNNTYPLDVEDMRAFKKCLSITNRDEFMDFFFPGWEWAEDAGT